ncbi:uncharacterized protein si:ch211-67e16.3 isoform X2 [Ictalurus furcatus]|uniref:uncharacterized protein si:ch211-67e16.3 isoform X2 n=1 Tax=Ictalurus furcatus TaxID=66913 RepID=UPI0023506EA2|nr:uncharacterized protein si:ch211-67e16.3 isoform X2 [Ictalurus furcatus]
MSDRDFTLLFCLSLTLQHVCTGFQVWTLLQYNSKDNNSVNIICQHNALESWTMGAEVLMNNKNFCNTEQNNTACEGRQEGKQFNFTLKITAEQRRLPFNCMVYKSGPLPVQVRKGEEMMLFPGCDIPPPIPTDSCKCLDVGSDCAHTALVGLLTWALIGFVLLLILYSFIITVVYIKLRLSISEELTLTYVPMQQNWVRPKKKVKVQGADKNAEYMDMRKVHPQAQPISDMNHNSCLNPVGFSV